MRGGSAAIQIAVPEDYAVGRGIRNANGNRVTRLGCGNCGAALSGPYCAQCGQHVHDSARGVSTLFHDAWHVATHVDGRLWRTLAALLLRPGFLTREYFAERRARYLPPVRVYLVLSVLFFALPSPGGKATAEDAAAALKDSPAAAADIAEARQAIEAALTAKRGAGVVLPAAAAHEESASLNIDTKDCDKVQTSPRWLEEPLRRACRRNVADGGRALKHALLANVPKMMFVFLPIMALVMLLLYWWPRHYYVEHLVFFLHTHAALFLLLLLTRLASWLAVWMPALAAGVKIAKVGAFGYAVWYVYQALRRYYGQRRWLTLTKLAFVGIAYAVCLAITLLGTVVVTALTA